MFRTLIPTLLAVLTSLVLAACGGDAEVDSAPTQPPSSAAVSPVVSSEVGGQPDGTQPDGTSFEITLEDPGGSGSYKINPSELVFGVGQTVTFSLTSETEFHNFVVDDLGIDQSVNAGETVEFTFAFDKPGSFSLICIPHQVLGMVGTITVQ